MGLLACMFHVFFFLVLPARGSLLPNGLPPAPVYVFGDSTADVGNNNYLSGDTKANYPHYGIDFPRSIPTGRFSNGYNGIDFLAIHMGFRRSPPPYLSLANKTGHQILMGLRGANFASGGSGILDSTGSTITMRKQIQYFEEFKSHLVTRTGVTPSELSLSKSIFLISSGGNDIFNFFSQNNSPSSAEKEQFIETLLFSYKNHIKTLYSLGARKIALIDVPPIGCCPYSRALSPLEDCIDVLNELARGFNEEVKTLMTDLRSTLPGMKHSIGSSYALILSIVANRNYHNEDIEVKNACCGAGTLSAQIRCNPNTTYCADRHSYLFWDLLHPSHATAEKAGLAFYSGPSRFAFPINVKQLIEDDGS